MKMKQTATMIRFLGEVSSKAIIEIQTAAKKLSKKEPKLYKTANLDKDVVAQAADLKAQIDVLETKLAALKEDYAPLRDTILADCPGDKIDKVEVLIDGVQVKKYSQVRGAGALDQEKAIRLARAKKLMGKITYKINIVDEDALAVAVAKGLVTQEEYASCLNEGNTIEMLKVERKFNVAIDPEADGEAVV